MIDYLTAIEALLGSKISPFEVYLGDSFRSCPDLELLVINNPALFEQEDVKTSLLRQSPTTLDELVTLALAWCFDYRHCLTKVDLQGNKIVDFNLTRCLDEIAKFIHDHDLTLRSAPHNLANYLVIAVKANNLTAVKWLLSLTSLHVIVTEPGPKSDSISDSKSDSKSDPTASPQVNRAFVNNLFLLAFQQGYHEIVEVLLKNSGFIGLNHNDNYENFNQLVMAYRKHHMTELMLLESHCNWLVTGS